MGRRLDWVDCVCATHSTHAHILQAECVLIYGEHLERRIKNNSLALIWMHNFILFHVLKI